MVFHLAPCSSTSKQNWKNHEEAAARKRNLDASAWGTPIADLALVLEGGFSGTGTTTTDDEGCWQAVVRGDFTVRLEKKEGYAFRPQQQEVMREKPEANFEGAKDKIIGRVTIQDMPPGREAVMLIDYVIWFCTAMAWA